MDLSALSVAELNKLLSDIPKEISRREKGEKARIRKELEALAAAQWLFPRRAAWRCRRDLQTGRQAGGREIPSSG